MAVKLQLRRDTSANWAASNPILAEGEIGIDTTLREAKVGDGATAWDDLPYGLAQAAPGVRYDFSTTTTDADPGAGLFRLNNATPASATEAYFDNVDAFGTTVTAWLDALDDSTSTVKGYLRLQKQSDGAVFREYSVSGSVVDGTGYRKVTIAHVVGNGSFSSGDRILVSFARTGNKGADGAGIGDLVAANNLSDVASAATARTNLGLAIGTDVQAYDADLAAIAALATTSAGRSALTIADPNADRMLAWDDSASAVVPIAVADITTEAAPATGDFVLAYTAEGALVKIAYDDVGGGGGGSGPYARTNFIFSATAGQTSFSGNDAYANLLAYTPGRIDVFLNGRLLDPADYTATSGAAVVLDAGATAGDQLFVAAWQAAAPSVGSRVVYRYVSTASQTTFSGADANSATLAYVVGNIDVFVNGRLIPVSEYTATNGSSVVFSTGLTASDVVLIVAFTGTLNLTEFTPASAAGSARLRFNEDTDNGTSGVTLKGPESLAASVEVTLPSAAGTIIGTGAETLSAASQATARSNISAALKGHIFGLTASNAADADHDLTFAIGEAASTETNPVLMKLLSSLTKQFDATWAVGNNAGGMQSGSALPTSGTVHVHLMERSDTGVVDIIGVPNGTTLVLPSGYDRSRRIMSFCTDSSANIRGFKQIDDTFYYSTGISDYSSTSSRADALLTISVPTGIICQPIFYYVITSAAAVPNDIEMAYGSAYAGASQYTIERIGDGTYEKKGGTCSLPVTNTSAQIYFKVVISSGSLGSCGFTTIGWIDTRGKDA
jgi:uncharacterized protein YdeI (BOF family)